MQEAEIKALLEELKKPTLKMQLVLGEDTSPNLNSHFGGHPYLEQGEKCPLCNSCEREMTFIFQLYIPREKEYDLYSFYYCFHCQEEKEEYALIKHQNPSKEKMIGIETTENEIPYCELILDPSWSVPDWDNLCEMFPDLMDEMSDEEEEEAYEAYERVKDEIMNEEHYETFSFYGGYPEFIQDEEVPICECCEKEMNLWVQLDSFDEIELKWKNMGCLYLFKCPTGNENYKVFVQSF